MFEIMWEFKQKVKIYYDILDAANDMQKCIESGWRVAYTIETIDDKSHEKVLVVIYDLLMKRKSQHLKR